MDVVVVESPAKAKTINKYLGSGYVVLASYGHVRDLPAKNGSVRPEEDFAMDYESDPKSAKHVKAIAEAMRGADHLYLATDPDREGEAISWHVLEALEKEYGLKDIDAKRVVFNEITKRAVLDGISNPRDLDTNLINAQQARRALDYLVGFTLSPVLWRKLPGARSAGRVQSVALRLVCDREIEIEAFVPREYWTIEVDFRTAGGDSLVARLTHLNGEKLDRFSLANEEAAMAAVAAIEAGDFKVASVETKPTRRNPSPPFTTSTLQQEASRKLRFGARKTMQVAQKLYEGIDLGGETVGLITYMRTDGVQMANEAIAQARDMIGEQFGSAYRPDAPRVYRTKAKNAQEAHEAIRPTDFHRHPNEMRRYLDQDQARLYELIWIRAVASQMESARLLRTTIDIAANDSTTMLRATGTVVDFPGFLTLYQEGEDDRKSDDDGDDQDRRLPKVASGEALNRDKVRPDQHFTEPPPRYTEATLVKKLEELGIGRPSTYASILSVLQDRNYVLLEKGRFIPEDKGRLVTAFLESYFARYVEYGFTADLENRLDEISAGEVDWKAVLREFWINFSNAVEGTAELRVRDVFDAINELLAPHLYPNGGAERTCPACKNGQLSLKGGRNGFFIGCSTYPECRYTRSLGASDASDEALADGPKHLCDDPDTGLPVTLRKGPFGLYFQLGEQEEGGEKPKRASLPKDIPLDEVTPEMALQLLNLPREVGEHPETGKPIYAGIGRYGPYLQTDGRYIRLETTFDALSIGLNMAVTKIAEAPTRGGRRGATELRKLGEHPDGGEIAILDGRYGPYIKYKKINATLPKDRAPEEITIEEALELIRAKAEKTGAKGGRKKAAGKAKKAGGTKKSAAAKGKKSSKKAAAAKDTGSEPAGAAGD
jgi:DNA topoisomerase-1